MDIQPIVVFSPGEAAFWYTLTQYPVQVLAFVVAFLVFLGSSSVLEKFFNKHGTNSKSLFYVCWTKRGNAVFAVASLLSLLTFIAIVLVF